MARVGDKLILLRGSWKTVAAARPKLGAPPILATLGNFDGVHLGHRQLLRILREKRARQGEGTIVVVSFYPHPVRVLRGGIEASLLTSLRQKVELLAAEGVDALALIHFTPEFARLSAGDFVRTVLREALGTDFLCVGADARVGAAREGTPEFLKAEFARDGRAVEIVPFLSEQGEKVSSGVIRRLVEQGDLDRAAGLLGRPYVLAGRVVHGMRRGSRIGIPTANLAASAQVLPPIGVYASRAELNRVRYAAVTNVGMRPTFGGSRVVVETHLLDYHGSDFYGARLKVQIAGKIRDEVRYEGVDALAAQIHRDMEAARCLLSRSS